MENLRDERDMTVVKEHVTWNDVEDFVKWLADKTNNFEGFTGVYGPARGGVTYAAIISNKSPLIALATLSATPFVTPLAEK